MVWESYEEFDKGIQERVAKAMRPISVCAGDDGRWAAYFEGKVRPRPRPAPAPPPPAPHALLS